ncbi:MAG: dephospho-CoA kinase [Clostridia bacterium]|nr:dephospho-CoA kinase [Clostridia bacterium]
MILGLTGGIATGKSTISKYLASKGIPIIDCDKIALKIMIPNTPAVKEIRKVFGERFFKGDLLDRQLLGRYCFENEERTKLLNSIVHPYIFGEMEALFEKYKDEKIVVLDAPLLIETGLHERCDKVMVVVCTDETRIIRGISRSNLSRLDMRNRIKRQLSDVERRKYADYVVDNEGALEKTLQQVDEILKELNYE